MKQFLLFFVGSALLSIPLGEVEFNLLNFSLVVSGVMCILAGGIVIGMDS